MLDCFSDRLNLLSLLFLMPPQFIQLFSWRAKSLWVASSCRSWTNVRIIVIFTSMARLLRNTEESIATPCSVKSEWTVAPTNDSRLLRSQIVISKLRFLPPHRLIECTGLNFVELGKIGIEQDFVLTYEPDPTFDKRHRCVLSRDNVFGHRGIY